MDEQRRDHHRSTVVVVGGGYGGVVVASQLDEVADVVLVEPKDAFMHNVAALRALVDPSWQSRIFMPYGGLLSHGRWIRDRAVLVEPDRVVTASGEVVTGDYLVLSSGSSYPFPAKTDLAESNAAKDQLRAAHHALIQADRVLLVGAGPVGIELAGEVLSAWPEKSITLLDLTDDILGGEYRSDLRAEIHRQLGQLGVELRLGSPLHQSPPTIPGELGTFTVTTDSGIEVTADIWFRCHGVVPNSDYLGEALRTALRSDGYVQVQPTLQVVGQESVFAVGDLSTADAKMGGFAQIQARTVATNIATLVAGGSALTAYQPIGAALVLPLGPEGGSGQIPGHDDILASTTVAEMKGRHMGIDGFTKLFGLAPTRGD